MHIMQSQKSWQKKYSPFSNPIVVALDLDDDLAALKLADDLADIVGGFKLGPRLCLRYGQSFVQEIAKRGPVFIDQKYFDIPSTMLAAVQASFDAGASVVTIHALSGIEALIELAALEMKLNEIRPFKILCVTILTSWSENSCPPILKPQNIIEHVRELTQMVVKSGLSGIVCSSQELEFLEIEKNHRNLFCLTPGIRLRRDPWGDQKRVMEPLEALDAGASALVVGRPIVEAKNPKIAAAEYTMAVFKN